MKNNQNLISSAFEDADLLPQDIPNIDLYMDQVLTLIDEGLHKNKRYEYENIITKTMINNYSKEKIISSLRSKKYSKEQIIEILFIINLKQNLSLGDIKIILNSIQSDDNLDIQRIYEGYIARKAEFKTLLQNTITQFMQKSLLKEDMFINTLLLSSGGSYLKNLCKNIIDVFGDEQKKNDSKTREKK